MTRKYPLDPLRRVRAENVDREVRALSGSLRHVDAARGEAERAEQHRRELETTVAVTQTQEGDLLERGALTAADLARGAAWKVATEIERSARARAVEHARDRQNAAERAASQHRADLGTAKAAEELVAKHHGAWVRAGQAASLSRDEEDAEEAHRGRRGVS